MIHYLDRGELAFAITPKPNAGFTMKESTFFF